MGHIIVSIYSLYFQQINLSVTQISSSSPPTERYKEEEKRRSEDKIEERIMGVRDRLAACVEGGIAERILQG
jgi:hypothetical protein